MRARIDERVVRPILTLPDDGGDTTLDTGLSYRAGEAVVVRIRRRGRRYDITDDGAAVSLAGRPTGWLEIVERQVAEDGFNANRRGVVSVPAVEGRDIEALAFRLADSSRSTYLALLDTS